MRLKTKMILNFLMITFFISCMSQDSMKSQIQGNWYIEFEDIDDKYGEFLIDENRVCYFNEMKEIFECNEYYIENNTFFLKKKPDINNPINMGAISLNDGILTINNEDGITKFSRQTLKPNLEQFIHNEVDLEAYYLSFSSRAANWTDKKFKLKKPN